MPRDLISAKTRVEFREYFVATTLGKIADAFDAEGLTPDEGFEPKVSGQRRSLVEQYYHTIKWSERGDVARILKVYEAVLVELDLEATSDDVGATWAKEKATALRRWLARDGVREENGQLILPGHVPLQDALAAIDAPELQRQIDRMRSSVDSDPGLAIGTAKELVETVCKTILVERNCAVEADWDIARLVKETRGTLSLLPSDIPDASKGVESIRRLLSNLGSVVAGIAELRNLYGTGHGKHGRAKGAHPRHARLAVGAAATLTTFLFETHNARDA